MSSLRSGVEIRLARDTELERTVRLRWLWARENGETPADSEAEFSAKAAEWARAHASTHLPHVAVAVDGAIIGMAWLALTVHASQRSVDMYTRHGFRASDRLLWADGATRER